MSGVVLTGERVTLREFVIDDLPAVHDYASRPEASRYQAWGPNTPEESRAFLEDVVAAARAEPHSRYELAVELRETRRLIGSGGLQVHSRRFRQGEISYIIHPELWGRGYASELGAASLAHAFGAVGLGDVVAFTQPNNAASRRVMEKLEFAYEKDIVHAGLPHVL